MGGEKEGKPEASLQIAVFFTRLKFGIAATDSLINLISESVDIHLQR